MAALFEEHVDPAKGAHCKTNQRLTVGRLGQIAWLPGDHRSTRAANRLNRGFRVVDLQTAADD
jgi:hypothetical protein